MRVSILLLLVAIYHGFHGVECDINFPLAGASKNTYQTFIANLRQQLSIDTQKVYNITVLKHQVATPNQRFLLVHLSNYDSKTITLGVDVFDVYLVGYLTGTNSYIFKEAPALAYTNTLFPGSRRTNLTYTGSYIDLERNGARENIPLGFSPLDSAITNLFLYEATLLRKAFLVIIQMISEAARFKYIETTVAKNAVSGTYKPDPGFLSLENNWGALSTQIQRARNHGGIFPTPVVLKKVSGNSLEVKNVSDPVVKGVALMKYERLGSVIVEMHDVM